MAKNKQLPHFESDFFWDWVLQESPFLQGCPHDATGFLLNWEPVAQSNALGFGFHWSNQNRK